MKIIYNSTENNIFLTEGEYYNNHKRRGYGTTKNLFNVVELEITTDCNLKCVNCDRSCRQAPSKERMTLMEIQKFVNESIEHQHKWKRIVVLGGEPTLHPDLNRIFDILKTYKNTYQECDIKIYSNGFGNYVTNTLKSIPNWVKIKNSRKKSPVKHGHSLYNNAPIDHGLPATVCSIPWRCGLGLTKNGYYPCGAGASIDRIFKFGIGIQKIKDLTFENIIKQLQLLCKYCGYNPLISKQGEQEIVSPIWKKQYKTYNKR